MLCQHFPSSRSVVLVLRRKQVIVLNSSYNILAVTAIIGAILIVDKHKKAEPTEQNCKRLGSIPKATFDYFVANTYYLIFLPNNCLKKIICYWLVTLYKKGFFIIIMFLNFFSSYCFISSSDLFSFWFKSNFLFFLVLLVLQILQPHSSDDRIPRQTLRVRVLHSASRNSRKSSRPQKGPRDSKRRDSERWAEKR